MTTSKEMAARHKQVWDHIVKNHPTVAQVKQRIIDGARMKAGYIMLGDEHYLCVRLLWVENSDVTMVPKICFSISPKGFAFEINSRTRHNGVDMDMERLAAYLEQHGVKFVKETNTYGTKHIRWIHSTWQFALDKTINDFMPLVYQFYKLKKS